jgi:NADH dehydrogenase
MAPPRVLILGAGFAGLACAKALRRFPGEVTLVDRTNHHLFQPLLYQVASAGLSGSDVAQPIRSILRRQANLRVHMASVTAIDLAARTATIDFQGRTLPFDYLVIALGVASNYFGHDEWAPHALGLKSLADAYAIRARLLAAYERAENLPHEPDEQRVQLTTIVIGGGPTGVEMAGACVELARRVARPEYRVANLAAARVVLIDAGDRLLSTFDESLSHKARADLERMGVEVLLNTRVGEITARTVATTDGRRIDAATIVWAAGVAPAPLVRTLGGQGLPLDRSGRIIVGPDCSPAGFPHVFAAGDISSCTDGAGVKVPGLAQGAMQMGRHAARVILADHAGQRADAGHVVYRDKGEMATIGRSRAVADVRGFRTTGFVAWVVWLSVHLVFLIDLRSKISVMLKWIAAYAFYRPAGRLLDAPHPPSLVPTAADTPGPDT